MRKKKQTTVRRTWYSLYIKTNYQVLSINQEPAKHRQGTYTPLFECTYATIAKYSAAAQDIMFQYQQQESPNSTSKAQAYNHPAQAM